MRVLRLLLAMRLLTYMIAFTWWILRAISSACFKSADRMRDNAGNVYRVFSVARVGCWRGKTKPEKLSFTISISEWASAS